MKIHKTIENNKVDCFLVGECISRVDKACFDKNERGRSQRHMSSSITIQVAKATPKPEKCLYFM